MGTPSLLCLSVRLDLSARYRGGKWRHPSKVGLDKGSQRPSRIETLLEALLENLSAKAAVSPIEILLEIDLHGEEV